MTEVRESMSDKEAILLLNKVRDKLAVKHKHYIEEMKTSEGFQTMIFSIIAMSLGEVAIAINEALEEDMKELKK